MRGQDQTFGTGRALPRLVVLVAGVLAVAAVVAGPAGAHGGGGVMEVDEPTSTGDLTMSVQVRITYEADGHAVEPGDLGEVDVSGTGPSGATLPAGSAVAPTDVPGVYAIDLSFPEPGLWDLVISASEPPVDATLAVDVPAVADAPGEGADDEPAETDAEADDGAAAGADDEVTGDVGAAPISDDAGAGELVEQSDSGAPLGLIAGMLVCLALAGGGYVLWRRSQARA